jgi:hypothetical protein
MCYSDIVHGAHVKMCAVKWFSKCLLLNSDQNNYRRPGDATNVGLVWRGGHYPRNYPRGSSASSTNGESGQLTAAGAFFLELKLFQVITNTL